MKILPYTKINKDERGLVLGQSGTGKTTLSKILINPMKYLIVLDPKHEFTLKGIDTVTYSIDETVEKSKEIDRIIYRPSIQELESQEEMNRFFMWVFNRRNTFLYVDEITAVVKSAQSYPQGLRAIYTMGRSRNVGILAASQRPAYMPKFIISESLKVWKFFLKLKPDQQYAAEFMGETVLEPKDYPINSAHKYKHSFYYYEDGQRFNAKQYILEF